MVDVVFEEDGVGHPSSEKRLVVGKSDDVFLQDVIGGFETLVHLVPSVVACSVEGITQVDQMSLDNRINKVGSPDGQRPLVVAQGACPSCDFIA